MLKILMATDTSLLLDDYSSVVTCNANVTETHVALVG